MITTKRQQLAEVERAARIGAMFGMGRQTAALNAKAAGIREEIRKGSRTEVECLVKGGAR